MDLKQELQDWEQLDTGTDLCRCIRNNRMSSDYVHPKKIRENYDPYWRPFASDINISGCFLVDYFKT